MVSFWADSLRFSWRVATQFEQDMCRVCHMEMPNPSFLTIAIRIILTNIGERLDKIKIN